MLDFISCVISFQLCLILFSLGDMRTELKKLNKTETEKL